MKVKVPPPSKKVEEASLFLGTRQLQVFLLLGAKRNEKKTSARLSRWPSHSAPCCVFVWVILARLVVPPPDPDTISRSPHQ